MVGWNGVGFMWKEMLGWLRALVAESLVDEDDGFDVVGGTLLFWLDNQTLQEFAGGFAGEHDLDCKSHIFWLDPPNLRERKVVGVELDVGLVGLVLGVTVGQ
ncbi:hypothetical protein GGX14DRAFT_393274 [Mycena pura]|uniref:Uncharacterized protein n=1 Tax=Mycena pura TaxID=153505 RepID=A0AAD6VPU1_9AGAR|nr:hypothetical protein GGX14DRAFT_393274 [Mycena pura]